jgi:large subunit ribosomal protein L41
MKPYVALDVKLTEEQKKEVYGKLPPGGLTGSHYYENQLWKRKFVSPAVTAVETKAP